MLVQLIHNLLFTSILFIVIEKHILLEEDTLKFKIITALWAAVEAKDYSHEAGTILPLSEVEPTLVFAFSSFTESKTRQDRVSHHLRRSSL